VIVDTAKCPANGFGTSTPNDAFCSTDPDKTSACGNLATYLQSCKQHGYAVTYDTSNNCCNTEASCTTYKTNSTTSCSTIHSQITEAGADYAIVEVECDNGKNTFIQWNSDTACEADEKYEITQGTSYYIAKLKKDDDKETWLYVAAACFCAAIFLVIANKFI